MPAEGHLQRLGYDKTDVFKIRFTAGSKTVVSNPVGPLSAGAATLIRVETAANGVRDSGNCP